MGRDEWGEELTLPMAARRLGPKLQRLRSGVRSCSSVRFGGGVGEDEDWGRCPEKAIVLECFCSVNEKCQ